MVILSLPVEILLLVFECLSTKDLWSLYNSCQLLRPYVALCLFRTAEIRFSGAIPVLLNGRPFRVPQNRLLKILDAWAIHVREVDVWGDEDSIQPEFLDLLPRLENVTTFSVSYPPNAPAFQLLLAQLAIMPSLRKMNVDFMSPRTWIVPMLFGSLRSLYLSCIEHEPGISVLPSLPALETLALNFCCYCLDCPRNGQQPCTMLHFDRLPRLLSLSISGAHEGNIICSGMSPQLRKLDISFSSGLSLSMILASVGPSLEEVHICDCEFPPETPLSDRSYPILKNLSILDSVSALAPFSALDLPSVSRLVVRVHADGLDIVHDWPQAIKLLRSRAVDLSLSCPVDSQCFLDLTCRLSQVASLPRVRRVGPNWPRLREFQSGD